MKCIVTGGTLTRRYQNALGYKFHRMYLSQQPKPFESIPSLSSLPIVGTLHHFLPVIGSIGFKTNFLEMTRILHERFGPIVKMEGFFVKRNMVILYDPDLYEQVYRSEESNPLRPGFEILVNYREELRKSTFKGVYGLTTAQGEKWHDFRRKVNPALLKPKLVKLYAPALEDIAVDMVDRVLKLQQDEDYLKDNWYNEITKWSLESVALVGLGTRLGSLNDGLSDDHPSRQLIKCSKDIMDLAIRLEMLFNIWRLFPTPNYKKLIKTLDLQWDVSKMYIDQAQKLINLRGHDIPDEDKSILEKLLAIDETVAIMMANEMLMAGIDTVSFTTTGLFYNLATYPGVQEKVRQEILSEEPQKRYLRACLKESLRLWPVISANLRRTGKEHIVGGYRIPKGVDVIAPNEYLSKMEKYYPRPTEFIPERWLADKSDPLYYGNAHPMVTLPFGFGIRSCIGRRIAELEIETLVKKFLERVKITWTGPPINVRTTIMNEFVKPYHFKFERLK